MTTAINIASNALVRLGANAINSFDEGGSSGTNAEQLYEPTLHALLTESRWRFAVAKRTLARLVDVPLNEYSYAFQIPADNLMVIRTYHNSDYEIYEDKIFSNQPTLDIDYIFRPSEGRFPAWFTLLFEFKLAAELCQSVTSNRKNAELFEQKYMMQLAKAQFADSSQRTIQPITSSPYTDVRG